MNTFEKKVGEVRNKYYFAKKCGPGKRYSRGPTCIFPGKVVPNLTRWSPKGSVTLKILVDILATLDHIGVFGRLAGRKPFLLLDGHSSQFELPFLRYVINKVHKWVVCIGVPYGTSHSPIRDHHTGKPHIVPIVCTSNHQQTDHYISWVPPP